MSRMGVRVANMLARGVVVLVDAAGKIQRLQLRLTANEPKDGVEHFEPYGFTSRPLEGAEAVVAFVGGDRSHGVAIVVGDRRYRLQGLQSGEVALFTDEGDRLVFQRGNQVLLQTKNFLVEATETVTLRAGQQVVLDAPKVRATASFSAAGAAHMEGGLGVDGDMTNNGVDVGSDHEHDGVVKGNEISGGPVR